MYGAVFGEGQSFRVHVPTCRSPLRRVLNTLSFTTGGARSTQAFPDLPVKAVDVRRGTIQTLLRAFAATNQSAPLSMRGLLEVVFVLAAALAGGLSVYVGEAQQWPGFHVRDGYWGTAFMSDFLYAAASDTTVKLIVACCWAQYAAVPALAGVVLLRFWFPVRRSAK